MRTVLFVCEHGAFRSRIAAAYFNAAAPPGWRAESAGRDPQPEVSPHLARLLTGEGIRFDTSPPRRLSEASGDRVVAIDCDVAGAERWSLPTNGADERLRDGIKDLVSRFMQERLR